MEYRYKLEKINTKYIACLVCLKVERKALKKVILRRKPLIELLKNIVRKLNNKGNWKRPERALRTYFGC